MLTSKKIKDLTQEEIHNWLETRCPDFDCSQCPFCAVDCGNWWLHKDMYSDKFLNETIQIDLDILTEEEKNYLRAIIKFFKDRVKYIVLRTPADYAIEVYGKRKYLRIEIYVQSLVPSAPAHVIYLPYFVAGDAFTGMETGQQYTLKELKL